MSKSKRCVVAPDEQTVLDGIHLQLIKSEGDIARCNALITQHHYLNSRTFPPLPRSHRKALTRKRNCGRWEIRSLDLREVPSTQLGFVGARTAARLRTRVTRDGKCRRTVVFLISRLSI